MWRYSIQGNKHPTYQQFHRPLPVLLLASAWTSSHRNATRRMYTCTNSSSPLQRSRGHRNLSIQQQQAVHCVVILYYIYMFHWYYYYYYYVIDMFIIIIIISDVSPRPWPWSVLKDLFNMFRLILSLNLAVHDQLNVECLHTHLISSQSLNVWRLWQTCDFKERTFLGRYSPHHNTVKSHWCLLQSSNSLLPLRFYH